MTLQEAKSIARLGLTLRQVRSGAYRVNFRDGNETTAYYTDSLEDAVKTAVEMARTRDVVQAVDGRRTERDAYSHRRAADRPDRGAPRDRGVRWATPLQHPLADLPGRQRVLAGGSQDRRAYQFPSHLSGALRARRELIMFREGIMKEYEL